MITQAPLEESDSEGAPSTSYVTSSKMGGSSWLQRSSRHRRGISQRAAGGDDDTGCSSGAGSCCRSFAVDRSKATLDSLESRRRSSRRRRGISRGTASGDDDTGSVASGRCRTLFLGGRDNAASSSSWLWLTTSSSSWLTTILGKPSTVSVLFLFVISEGCRLAPLECRHHADLSIILASFSQI